MPGVQKPHCRPWQSMKACWIGWRSPPCGQAFDAGDAPALGLQRQHRAALHRLAVEQHGAGAALAGVAADMGAGQAELLAQHFDQQALGVDLQLHGLAVDFEVQVAHGWGVLSSARGDRSARREHGAGVSCGADARHGAGRAASAARSWRQNHEHIDRDRPARAHRRRAGAGRAAPAGGRSVPPSRPSRAPTSTTWMPTTWPRARPRTCSARCCRPGSSAPSASRARPGCASSARRWPSMAGPRATR